MPAGNPSLAAAEPHAIEYLSSPAPVRMDNEWFGVAPLRHFWVERRFEAMHALAGPLVVSATEMAEVGCGHGLLQRQVEDFYNKQVTGFDLNEAALRVNLSRASRVCCYDIHQRDAAFRQRFDLIFLFDVIEHIPDATGFLQSVAFHLAPCGKLIVNVPAGQWLFSEYDRANGHVCRYAFPRLQQVAESAGFSVVRWTYWGLPFIPMLALRKVWLAFQKGRKSAVAAGFDSRSETLNSAFRLLSHGEALPQRLMGTSLLAVLEPQNATRP
jgi:SAM-dependent methyltransferase